MKIVSFQAENVKKLKAVEINPDGSVVVIGGNNEQGKTCILDCIQYGIDGAGSIPSKPIRDGQDKGHIILELDDIIVTRKFTKSGTTLVVKNKDGATFSSPQTMLDKLKGVISFDALKFSNMPPKEQADILKKLVGLDFDDLDKEYKKVFDQRTDTNRRGKEVKANLDACKKYDDVPDKEESLSELSQQYSDAVAHNHEIDQKQLELARKNDTIKELEQRISKLKAESKELEKFLAKNGSVVKDVDALKKKIESIEETNQKVRSNIKYNELDAQVNKLRGESSNLRDKLEGILLKKKTMLSKAKFPIKGLSVEGDQVFFKDIPFDQCSAAQRIKISVAIGLALNPKIKVLLIREGSLLDEKNLEMIGKMAAKSDAQIWIERVGKGDECQVIIEDGSVLEGVLDVSTKG